MTDHTAESPVRVVTPLTFTFDHAGPAFRVDPEARTIRGMAVPFGQVATSAGQRWSFSAGTLDWSRAKVLEDHAGKALGRVASATEGTDGVTVALSIAKGQRGDELLSLADDGVYDGLSIGLGNDVQFRTVAGVNRVTSGTVREVSVTPFPAFDDARVTSVALSDDQSDGEAGDRAGDTGDDTDDRVKATVAVLL